MKKMILTLWVLTLGLAAGAQAPQPNHGKDASKAALPSFIAAEEVTFKGDGVTLAGTLFLPKNKSGQRVPAVLMVADFYSLREGVKVNQGQHSTYRDLAIHLVERGYAVLRYDRRCTGASECNLQATMAVASDDGVGGVNYLRARKEIDANKIVVFGHGDGSFIAASIAANKQVAGLIATAAPGRNASKLLREWAKLHVQDRKLPEAEARQYLEHVEEVIQRLAAGGAKPDEIKLAPQDELLAPLVNNPDYAYSWLLDDPLGLFPHVTGAVLVVHGGKDRRVSPREGVFIRDSLEAGSHKKFETHVLPEMDYFLKANTGAASYDADKDFARPLDPALLKLIDEWLAKTLK
jgi:hypothetical protein